MYDKNRIYTYLITSLLCKRAELAKIVDKTICFSLSPPPPPPLPQHILSMIMYNDALILQEVECLK